MGGHSDADITNMRRVIGKRLQASKMEVPHYYLTLDIEMDKVWPLTQFFLFLFCENSLNCLEGKSMTPRRGNTILFRSSQQPPCLRLGPLKGFLS